MQANTDPQPQGTGIPTPIATDEHILAQQAAQGAAVAPSTDVPKVKAARGDIAEVFAETGLRADSEAQTGSVPLITVDDDASVQETVPPPPPPPYNVKGETPGDTLVGMPAPTRPAPQPGDEVISKTLQIGGGKVTTPEQQQADSLEYVQNKFPVGSVIKCDINRESPDLENKNLTYGVVELVGKDKNGVYVRLSRLVPDSDRELNTEADFSASRLLELNKGIRDVMPGMVKDVNDLGEVAQVLNKLKEA